MEDVANAKRIAQDIADGIHARKATGFVHKTAGWRRIFREIKALIAAIIIVSAINKKVAGQRPGQQGFICGNRSRSLCVQRRYWRKIIPRRPAHNEVKIGGIGANGAAGVAILDEYTVFACTHAGISGVGEGIGHQHDASKIKRVAVSATKSAAFYSRGVELYNQLNGIAGEQVVDARAFEVAVLEPFGLAAFGWLIELDPPGIRTFFFLFNVVMAEGAVFCDGHFYLRLYCRSERKQDQQSVQ